jgi:hypothetical protein
MESTIRIIPAKQHAELTKLARWQLDAPVELTDSQLEACSQLEQNLLFEALGTGDLAMVWLDETFTLIAEDEEGNPVVLQAATE